MALYQASLYHTIIWWLTLDTTVSWLILGPSCMIFLADSGLGIYELFESFAIVQLGVMW